MPLVSWLGLGAQRCGTSWFCDLVSQHPQIGYGRSGAKELHILDSAIEHLDAREVRAQYEQEFHGLDGYRGEFSPSYLRALWAADLARKVINPTIYVVLLRDPVVRFRSAMTLYLDQDAPERLPPNPAMRARRLRQLATEAQWAGMYFDQLEHWSRAVGREKILVIQYEKMREDPERELLPFWSCLGLAPPLLKDLDVPSSFSATNSEWTTGKATMRSFEKGLSRIYAAERGSLASEYGIDPTLWLC